MQKDPVRPRIQSSESGVWRCVPTLHHASRQGMDVCTYVSTCVPPSLRDWRRMQTGSPLGANLTGPALAPAYLAARREPRPGCVGRVSWVFRVLGVGFDESLGREGEEREQCGSGEPAGVPARTPPGGPRPISVMAVVEGRASRLAGSVRAAACAGARRALVGCDPLAPKS